MKTKLQDLENKIKKTFKKIDSIYSDNLSKTLQRKWTDKRKKEKWIFINLKKLNVAHKFNLFWFLVFPSSLFYENRL